MSLSFGDFELDQEGRSSSGPGRPVPLEAKAYGPAESRFVRMAHRFGYAFCGEARDTTDERLRDASRPQPRLVWGDRVLLSELVMILYDHELTEPSSVLVEGGLEQATSRPGG